MAAFDQGWTAFQHGLFETENPYAPMSAEEDSWRAGWILAHDMDNFTVTVAGSYIA